MAILDSLTSRSGLFWRGLLLEGLSFSIFFGTIWYSVLPLYSYAGLWERLADSTPFIVGSLIFMAIGALMIIEGRKRSL